MLMRGGDTGSKLCELGEWLKELFPHTYVYSTSKAFLDSPYEYSVGLIVQPGVRGNLSGLFQAVTNPVQLANLWGHTALFVCQKGRVVTTIGFDPDRFDMFAKPLTGMAVGKGKKGTPGVFYDEDPLCNSPDVLVVEFEVTEEVTKHLLNNLPRIGPANPNADQQLVTYVTRGGSKLQGVVFDRTKMGNCLDWQSDMLKLIGGKNFGIDRQWLDSVGSGQGEVTKAILKRTLKVKGLKHDKRELQHRFQTMSAGLQLSRRVGGTLRTISAVRCAYKAARMLAVMQPLVKVELELSWPFQFEILFCVSLLVDFLEVALARGRWQFLPRKLIESIVATGAAMAVALTIYNGFDENAWINPLMSYAWLLAAWFGLA
jgi:hypothetical protein